MTPYPHLETEQQLPHLRLRQFNANLFFDTLELAPACICASAITTTLPPATHGTPLGTVGMLASILHSIDFFVFLTHEYLHMIDCTRYTHTDMSLHCRDLHTTYPRTPTPEH